LHYDYIAISELR